MIEYALLIMLGFCTAGLIAFLFAPTLWRRAVRLTTKRLEATLPMSLSDIEADKDLLRASYAMKIRRLESALNRAREKSANQLVDISKLQMRIGELNDEVVKIETQLDERRNAASVFENTIRKRFPELESMIAAAKITLEERAQEIADLTNKLRRREEALALSQRSGALQQQEIRVMRETWEKTGADSSGRFKRRPSQWTLDEYRSEYDRLNLELSKMREQLVLAQEREVRQIAVLKTELQQLGEQILTSAAAQGRQPVAPEPRTEPEPKPWVPSRPSAPETNRGMPARPPARGQPWPSETPKDVTPANREPVKTERNPPERSQTAETRAAPAPRPTTRSRNWMTPALTPSASSHGMPPSVEPAAEAAKVSSPEPGVEQATRDALKTLLDRGARMGGREQTDAVASTSSVEATHHAGTVDADDNVGQAKDSEPKLDKVFREILEGRPTAFENPSAGSGETDHKNGEDTTASSNGATEASVQPDSKAEDTGDAGDKTRTLLDRLRGLQERQTG